MNRLVISLCALVLLTGVTGCKHERPTYTVCLLDISKSITPDGMEYEFKAVDGLVDNMHRGDRLTIIPITGDAMSDTPGRIVHLEAPVHREPYDHDLVIFHRQAHERIKTMHKVAAAHPSNRTDILGALDVAKQEFEESQEYPQKDAKKTLVIFSDFIEDDGVYHFACDPVLASATGARGLAERLSKENGHALDDVRIRLNTLHSNDLRRLTPGRQKAIQAFWSDYLSARPNTTTR